MEPTDLDNIIKSKLLESNDEHQQEMADAKPFVWSAVQKELDAKKTLRWYHLAAAILLLMISFSFVLYGVQEKHKNEIGLLSQKIDQLQDQYQSQDNLLQIKNEEVKSLASELKNVEYQLTELQVDQPLHQKETIVYRTDTVYLKQVEYIAKVTDPVMTNENMPDQEISSSKQLTKVDSDEWEIDDAIYPSVASSKKQKSESIKVKFLRTSRN